MTDDGAKTYAAAGVSLATAETIVDRLRSAVESTGASGFGAFAGLYPLDDGRLLADNPEQKAIALAEVLDVERIDATVWLDETVVKFLPGGPQGRPQLHGELFI